MLANCSGSVKPALRFDVELEGAAAVLGRLADRAGRDLDVLRAQRGDDLARGQVERRGAAGVDPDAHRIVARAEQLDVADAVDAGSRSRSWVSA